ncbi:MAG: M12 family metallo-peptidase [Chitinophagales bacterium]|nr:M12 family metallo-peptidase [Chitinophagales bacterium]
MIKQFFTCIIAFFVVFSGYSQAFFTKKDEATIRLRSTDERTVIPERYQVYTLDLNTMKSYLQEAPMEFSGVRGLKIQIPMPDNSWRWFEVYESPVLQPGIAARYPSIKSYKAYGLDDRSMDMRIAISPMGFYAAVNTLDGEMYIDPYSEENIQDYIVYYVADQKSDLYKNIPMCGTDHDTRPDFEMMAQFNHRSEQVIIREYRLAMACTGEWGSVRRRTTLEACIADINTMVTRLNSIFERELAIRFRIIDDNDKLIFLEPNTDPYEDAAEGLKIVFRNTEILNNLLPNGSLDYDVGHVLAVCFDIGGVVAGGTCTTPNKGNGVTCNTNNDLTKVVTRVMAHEIGHQFDGSHTWNICKGIEEQRAANWAYEPGSGTTILSYAGSCGTDNVAGGNDEYFHVGSLIQMFAKTTPGGVAWECANKILTENHPPEAIVPEQKYIIPIGTPFWLTGDGYDVDGDELTYCWEQFDLGSPISLGTTDQPDGPLFRSVKPEKTANIRFIPKPASILTGQTAEKTEALPTVSRTLNFKLTVRDNNPIAEGVVWADYSVEVTDQAGPFKLTYPEHAEVFRVGQIITVTWDVANTNQAPVNCKKVNIFASYNSALRDDDPNLVLLAGEVDNNGAYVVTIPDRTTNLFRIIVKAADHIILSSSALPSKVINTEDPAFFVAGDQVNMYVCQPDAGEILFKTLGLGGFDKDINFYVVEDSLPKGVRASFEYDVLKPGTNNLMTLNTDDVVGSQTGQVIVYAIAEGQDTIEFRTSIYVEGGNIDHVLTQAPADGSEGLTGAIRFEWNSKPDAVLYEIEVASSPDFTAPHVFETWVTQDTFYKITQQIKESTIYYWRVRAYNHCKTGLWSEVKAFITIPLACKTYKSGLHEEIISSAANASASIPVFVDNTGTVSDININLIRANHSRLVDLSAYLVSPLGTEALLWTGKCGNQQNINVQLDDQAVDYFQCPINTGKLYRTDVPGGADKLERFNGEPMEGEWTLRLDDKFAGQGGKFYEFNLEVCASIDVASPYLVNNQRLDIHPGDIQYISKNLLEAQDADNTAEELTYTLVNIPAKGFVTFNGNKLTPGAQFTQSDLNNNRILYESLEDYEGTVYFDFTVYDGQGGWIGITQFEIFIDESIPVSITDINLEKEVFVYPNPANHLLNIVLSDKVSTFSHFVMTDIAGRVVMDGQLNAQMTELDVQKLEEGIYLMRLSDGNRLVTRKIVIMK